MAIYLSCVNMCECACVGVCSVHVEVSGQPMGIGLLFLPVGSRGQIQVTGLGTMCPYLVNHQPRDA